MTAAIRLAQKGRGRVSPNPLVGAVIVQGNKIGASGYHHFYGGPHAEVYALNKAGGRARGADLYINLEPCCHFGKTPPCTNALIESGIRRVFIGITDPNPLLSGKGINKLRRAGIAVETGIPENECRRLNESFIKYITLMAGGGRRRVGGDVLSGREERRQLRRQPARRVAERVHDAPGKG